MKRIGSPKHGNIRAFFAKCRKSPVRTFRKKVSADTVGERGGAKGGLEKVHSFVTFLSMDSLRILTLDREPKEIRIVEGAVSVTAQSKFAMTTIFISTNQDR